MQPAKATSLCFRNFCRFSSASPGCFYHHFTLFHTSALWGRKALWGKSSLLIMSSVYRHQKTQPLHICKQVCSTGMRGDGFLPELCAISIKKCTSSPRQPSCLTGRSLSDIWRVRRASRAADGGALSVWCVPLNMRDQPITSIHSHFSVSRVENENTLPTNSHLDVKV